MTTTDGTQIRQIVDALRDAWNRHDGAAFAAPFAADADFTNIMGLRAHGRDLIARGHQELFDTFFRGTRLATTIDGIRFLRPDVAVADVTLALEREDGSKPFGVQRAMAGLVLTRDAGGWSIVVFRNQIPFARPVAGPTEQELIARARGG